jgi:chloramphenicol 3-O phosphotransferase
MSKFQEARLERPKVIVLNGVGSVGKTSVSKALQRIAHEPFLHLAMDIFLEMLPPDMFGHPEGYIFETVDDGGKPSVVIHSGPVLARLMSGMRHAVAAMAEQGNNLVVDDVMFNGDEVDEYRRLLDRFDTCIVGLFAPLEILEQRERDRGDRDIGLARWQYERVHRGVRYDLEIDTTLLTPADVARTICEAFHL